MQQLLPCERENEETLFKQPVKATRIKQAAFLRALRHEKSYPRVGYIP
jgi:hypothetical protein